VYLERFSTPYSVPGSSSLGPIRPVSYLLVSSVRIFQIIMITIMVILTEDIEKNSDMPAVTDDVNKEENEGKI